MDEPVSGSLKLEEFVSRYEKAIGYALNVDQIKAVTHRAGPLYVTAGPGSGKSEVMVARALKLVLVDGLDPASIMLTTFTEKAAANLQDRISDRLLRMGYTTTLEDLRVGTLHGLCDSIMREYRYPPYADSRLLDDTEQHLFVYANATWINEAPRDFWERFRFLDTRASKKYGANKWQKVTMLVTLLNRVTDEDVDLATLEKSTDPPLAQLAVAAAEYRACLADKHRCDFSVLQVHFRQFLQSELGKKFVEGDFRRDLAPLRAILVDEYQDTNPIQEAIYFRLAQETGGEIAVVGDDDQALYRFRGGTVECIIKFPERCEDLMHMKPFPVQLRTNYRSLPRITQWAEQMLLAPPEMREKSARAPKDPMISARAAEPGFPALFRVAGPNAETTADQVVDVIAGMLHAGVVGDPSQIAILLKSTRESPRNAGPIADALRRHNIPVYNPRSKAFLETPEIAGMLGALIELVDADGHVGGTLRGRVSKSVATWRAQYARIAKAHRSLRTYIGQTHGALARKPPGAWLNFSLRDAFYRLLSREPFSSWAEDPNHTHRLGQLSGILEAFASVEGSDTLRVSSEEPGRISHGWLRGRFYPRLITFLHQSHLDDPSDLDYQIVPGYVHIMTVHQAKGLEFPIVFVDSVDMHPSATDSTYQLEDLLIPYSSGGRMLQPAQQRAVQDLVRFFYVAFTRAENALVLFGTRSNFGRATISVGA